MKKFFKGMDISSLPEFIQKEFTFADADGQPVEPFCFLQQNGVNSIRLRIWNHPELVPESGGFCNLSDTLEMAKKIKAHGMHFVLDFHYSDFWADPGQQNKPQAWKDLPFNELTQAVYDYTFQVLDSLRAINCLPDIVQIGNEIRSGMLFPDGAVPKYDQLAALVNAGIRAARDISADIQVMIHLDQGGRFYYLKEWFDAMFAAGMLPIDIIGISFYSFWHGTFMDLQASMQQLISTYHLPVIVAETAHPWRLCENGHVSEDIMKTAGLPAGIEEQKISLSLVMQITASMPEEMGLGVYYWEPMVVPGNAFSSWATNMGMLDETGKALPSFEVYRDFSRDTQFFADIDEYMKSLYQADETLVIPPETNLIPNGDFSKEFEGWWQNCSPEEFVTAEAQKQGIYVTAKCNFTYQLFRNIHIQKAGEYRFSVDYRGTNTTGVCVEIFLTEISCNGETDHSKEIFPSDVAFVTHELEPLTLPVGEVRIGVRISAPPVFGRIRSMALVSCE